MRRYLGICGTGAHSCYRRKVALIERKFPPFQECMSSSPLFKWKHFFHFLAMERLWEVHLERASQLDNDWKVVGAEGRTGAPLRIQSYVGGGYCDIR